MTTKQQRTAYNLTKIAQHLDCTDPRTGIYEIAKDNGIAMIELKQFDLDGGYVFVPEKEWDAAYQEKVRREKVGCLDPEYTMARLARKYRDDAMRHSF